MYEILPLCSNIVPLCGDLPICMCGYRFGREKGYIMVAKVNDTVEIG